MRLENVMIGLTEKPKVPNSKINDWISQYRRCKSPKKRKAILDKFRSLASAEQLSHYSKRFIPDPEYILKFNNYPSRKYRYGRTK